MADKEAMLTLQLIYSLMRFANSFINSKKVPNLEV